MALRSFDDSTSDEALQFILDRRCERNHPKRHRTGKRSAAISARKKRRLAAANEMRAATRRRYLAEVRAYWRGESDGHP